MLTNCTAMYAAYETASLSVLQVDMEEPVVDFELFVCNNS